MIWETVPFGDLSSSDKSAFSMGPFGSKLTQRDYVAHGVPLVRGVNLGNGRFYDDEFVYISQNKADEVLPANVEPGDLIFVHRGTIGQVSMIPRNPRFDRYVVCSSLVKARIDESKAVPEFYYYWFRSPKGQGSILANTSVVGVPGISTPLTTIRGLEVPFPNLIEQRAIAEVLGVLDDKIAVNDRIALTIEQLLSLKFDQLGMIDGDAVEIEPVSELIDFNPKERLPKDAVAPYIDMAALPTDRARISSVGQREPKSGAKYRNGDTLLARITPCLENGKTGYVDSLSEDTVGLGSTEFIVMRPKPGIPKQLPYFIARSKGFREHAIRNMEGTSGRQRVAASNLAGFPVSVPETSALRVFGEESERSFQYMKALGTESRTLAELRDTLLPRLMSGEIRVKDAERIVEDMT